MTQHTQHTNVKLVAERQLPQPRVVDRTLIQLDKSVIGKTFKKDAATVTQYFEKLSVEQITNDIEPQLKSQSEIEIKVDDKSFKIPTNVITVKRFQETLHVEEFTPSVIEPSFGIGRVLYTIWEHNFKIRSADAQRTVSKLSEYLI